MKNRSEKHQEILTELNNLNITNAEVILLAQLAMLCYGSVHLCKHTSSVHLCIFSHCGLLCNWGNTDAAIEATLTLQLRQDWHSSFFFIYIIQVFNYIIFFNGFIWSSWKIFGLGDFFGVSIVSKIAFGGKFSVSRVTGMIVGTGLYSYRSFVLLGPFFWRLSAKCP